MISKAFKYIPTWLTVDPLEYWVKADPAEQVDLRYLLLFFVSQKYKYISETFVFLFHINIDIFLRHLLLFFVSQKYK